MAVARQDLLDEELIVAKQRDGAQLGGGLDGEDVHGAIITEPHAPFIQI